MKKRVAILIMLIFILSQTVQANEYFSIEDPSEDVTYFFVTSSNTTELPAILEKNIDIIEASVFNNQSFFNISFKVRGRIEASPNVAYRINFTTGNYKIAITFIDGSAKGLLMENSDVISDLDIKITVNKSFVAFKFVIDSPISIDKDSASINVQSIKTIENANSYWVDFAPDLSDDSSNSSPIFLIIAVISIIIIIAIIVLVYYLKNIRIPKIKN